MTGSLRNASEHDEQAPRPDVTTCDDVLLEDREHASRDPRAIRILAKSIYRELRQSGQQDGDVMLLASELLSLLASDVKDRRRNQEEAHAGVAPPPRAR